jgi:hypothetical protein
MHFGRAPVSLAYRKWIEESISFSQLTTWRLNAREKGLIIVGLDFRYATGPKKNRCNNFTDTGSWNDV